MASAYSGLFTSPEQIRASRIEALQATQAQNQQMGGSMAGLLGQIAAGSGGMMAEAAAGIFGLKTEEEKKAEDAKLAFETIKAEPGTSQYFEQLSIALKDIDPAASLEMQEKAITIKQQEADNEYRQETLGIQKENLGISKAQLQVSQGTAALAQRKFNNEEDRKAAYATMAGQVVNSKDAMIGLGMNPELVETITSAPPEERGAYVTLVADRLEELATFTQTTKNPTSAIQNYTQLQQLKESGTPEQVAEFTAMVRGGKTQDLGDRIAILDPLGTVVDYIDKGVSPEQQPEAVAERETAKGQAKLDVEFKSTWSDSRRQLDESKAVVDRLAQLTQELPEISRMAVIGATALDPDEDPKLWRGTVAADPRLGEWMALYKRATSQQFLNGFQSLKGGGSITEIEGIKATEAQTILASRVNLGKDTLLAELNRLGGAFSTSLSKGDKRAAALVSGQEYIDTPDENAGKTRRKFNFATGKVE